MNVRYLLDTNIASYAIKKRYPAVDQHLERIGEAQVAISAITEGELRFGLARQKEAHRLKAVTEEFLARVEILAWDSAAAGAYGDLRAQLEARGEPVDALDLLIAAHAISAELILVTHDHVFARVKHLRIEDWTRTQ